MNERGMTDEERIDLALAQLEGHAEQESPDVPLDALPRLQTSVGGARGPTLSQLAQSRLPKVSTVCETCPLSLWFAGLKDLRCYCRLMHTITWDSADPRPLSLCDGPQLSSP